MGKQAAQTIVHKQPHVIHQPSIMTPTLKVYTPGGACQVAPKELAHDLHGINGMIDKLVKAKADRRILWHLDQEGDKVVVQNSEDLAYALGEASKAGKSCRLYVTPHHGCSSASRWALLAPLAALSLFLGAGPLLCLGCHLAVIGLLLCASSRVLGGCGRWRQRRRHEGACHGAKTSCRRPPLVIIKPLHSASDAHSSKERVEDSSSPEVTSGGEHAGNSATPSAPPPGDAFAGVDPETVSSKPMAEPALSAREIKEKVHLLRGELGFDELSEEAAAKMIVELGGRMSLIVRALVSNHKKLFSASSEAKPQ